MYLQIQSKSKVEEEFKSRPNINGQLSNHENQQVPLVTLLTQQIDFEHFDTVK